MSNGLGTKEQPWQLKTANGGSEYTMYRDETANPLDEEEIGR